MNNDHLSLEAGDDILPVRVKAIALSRSRRKKWEKIKHPTLPTYHYQWAVACCMASSSPDSRASLSLPPPHHTRPTPHPVQIPIHWILIYADGLITRGDTAAASSHSHRPSAQNYLARPRSAQLLQFRNKLQATTDQGRRTGRWPRSPPAAA